MTFKDGRVILSRLRVYEVMFVRLLKMKTGYPEELSPKRTQTVQRGVRTGVTLSLFTAVLMAGTGLIPAAVHAQQEVTNATPPQETLPAQADPRTQVIAPGEEAPAQVPVQTSSSAAKQATGGQQPSQPMAQQMGISQDAAAAQQQASPQTTSPAMMPATDTSGAALPPEILQKYGIQPETTADTGSSDAMPKVSSIKVETEGFDYLPRRTTLPMNEGGGSGEGKQSSEELQQEIRQEAYDAAITGLFPLNPDQIKGLLTEYDKTQRAANTPVYDDPKPEISVQTVSLDPGVAPVVIRTAVGNVTTLNVLDITGAPWPIQDVTWAGDFEVVQPEEGGHVVRITPMGQFAQGNIVIRLLTLKTPLTMTLKTSREVVQYRVDARIPEYGPFAEAPLMDGGKQLVAGDTTLTSILDGVMPSGMARLDVSGVDGRTSAYAMNGITYVRTPLTLLSPAWQSSVSSADGMNVYALSNAPVVLLSDQGRFTRATLKEKGDLLDE